MDFPAVLWVSVHRIPTGLGFLWTQTGLQSSPVPKNCMGYHKNKLELESTGVPQNPQESSGVQWIYVGSVKTSNVLTLDIFFCSVHHKIQTVELDISEDYLLICLYPKGYRNPDDVECGFLHSGLLIKVCKLFIYYLPTSIPSIRPFVLFSHHRHPQRHSMSKNPKKG